MLTPESIDGLGPRATEPEPPGEPPSKPPSADEAWRREVLERVRKRRQVRAHALPLFAEKTPVPLADGGTSGAESGSAADLGSTANPEAHSASWAGAPSTAAAGHLDLMALPEAPQATNSIEDMGLDLPLRPVEGDAVVASRTGELPSQSLVERPRPFLVTGPGTTRSLVADLPLVEPSRKDTASPESALRAAPAPAVSRAASMNDRLQAAFIDLGIWSAMSVTAFYFASRIARTSITGLGSAWAGLALFALVLAAAYILFFGGLSGATPGKLACGIEVKRYDGTPLGPLASLGRGFLGILGVGLLGISVWPAFWDKDKRTLHDRATDSKVTTV